MQNPHLTKSIDLSTCSREELLQSIEELRQENAQLRSQVVANRTDGASQKMSFRQAYAEKILDALPDMLTVVTDDGITVAVVSSEDTNHTGMTRSELCGVAVKEFLPDHVCGHVMLSIDQAKEFGQSENLSHLMVVDGKPHYFENRTVRIDDDCNLCVCRDITAETLAKLQLESLSYAVNLVSENIFSLNPKGEFLFTNKQFLKDHQQERIIGKSAVGVLFSCRTEMEWETLKQRVGEHNGALNYIHEHSRADGNSISYEVVVRSVRDINNDEEFWFFARNITQRLEQDREIKELNALMNAILSNIPTYLFVKDTADSRYLYWNKALEERMGISAAQAVGHTDEEIFAHRTDAAEFIQNDYDIANNNARIESIEEFVNTSGERRILKSIKVPIQRANRAPLIIATSLDITDLKLVERELIAAKQEADKSNQLKSAFLANMSHEIRTPLNAIVGFAKLIMNEDDKEAQQEFADIIDRNADLLLQLINDILDLSKIEAGTLDFAFNTVDFGELCGDMLGVHGMRTPQGVTLIYDNEGQALHITSDRNRLTQVLTNLLSNAIKFTHKGEIHFGYTVKEARLEAYVRDTGMGIAADKLPTIFDRFVKLNNFVAGTGLGLSITRTIVERLGGTIAVTSEVGVGTEFRFSIPLDSSVPKEEKSAFLTEISKRSTTENAPAKSILVVEDNDSNYLLLNKFFGDKYNHYRAKNGEEAVAMFRKHTPSMIIMDIKMPVMDGVEATRLIRALSTDVPIVALSAFACDSDKDDALKAGCNHFLTKPLSFNELQLMLDRYMK